MYYKLLGLSKETGNNNNNNDDDDDDDDDDDLLLILLVTMLVSKIAVLNFNYDATLTFALSHRGQ